jgi:hypothetical protein
MYEARIELGALQVLSDPEKQSAYDDFRDLQMWVGQAGTTTHRGSHRIKAWQTAILLPMGMTLAVLACWYKNADSTS